MPTPVPVTFFAVATLSGGAGGGQKSNMNVVAIFSSAQVASQKAYELAAATPNRSFYIVKAIAAYTSGSTTPVQTTLS